VTPPRARLVKNANWAFHNLAAPHEYGWSDARCSIAPVLARERLRTGMKVVFCGVYMADFSIFQWMRYTTCDEMQKKIPGKDM
jgi:hypothetical protein